MPPLLTLVSLLIHTLFGGITILHVSKYHRCPDLIHWAGIFYRSICFPIIVILSLLFLIDMKGRLLSVYIQYVYPAYITTESVP